MDRINAFRHEGRGYESSYRQSFSPPSRALLTMTPILKTTQYLVSLTNEAAAKKRVKCPTIMFLSSDLFVCTYLDVLENYSVHIRQMSARRWSLFTAK